MNSVSTDCTMSKLRNFKNSFEEALFSEDVEKEVYETLIEGVNSNLQSFHKYFKLKQNALCFFVLRKVP